MVARRPTLDDLVSCKIHVMCEVRTQSFNTSLKSIVPHLVFSARRPFCLEYLM